MNSAPIQYMFGVVWQYNKKTCFIFVHKFPVKIYFVSLKCPISVRPSNHKFTGLLSDTDCCLQALDRCHFWLNKEYHWCKFWLHQTETENKHTPEPTGTRSFHFVIISLHICRLAPLPGFRRLLPCRGR